MDYVFLGFKKAEGTEIFKYKKDKGIIENKRLLAFQSFDACSDEKNLFILIQENDYVKITDF